MTKLRHTLKYSGLVLAVAGAASPGAAQQIIGTPGSPEATVVIKGNQLPAPPVPFGGVIRETAEQSTPFWPPQVSPRPDAPNVLLIMTDDAGFGVASTFGGVIPTPNLDRVAKAGLKYNQFHSTALCSPTRAALITGRNHHSVGFGVISEQATGYPGYDSVIGEDTVTVARILRDNGYATSWFGKNHNTPAFQYSAAGPFDQWPMGMGFDYFYGFNGGETDQWHPYLFRNTTAVFPWLDKPGYNLGADLADDAINWLKAVKNGNPDRRWFLYFVPGGTHAPHQPPMEWSDKFKGKFDMGWNAMREQIYQNQLKLGVIPAGTKLTPWPKDLPTWDSLTPDAKRLFARQAEVFAGYVAFTDYQIGRVIDQVEAQGDLDKTLIIYIEGDNGTSAEGSTLGTPFDLAAIQAVDIPVEKQLPFIPIWGSDQTQPHMSVAWSWAFDAPFKWTKQVASYFGGTRQGMAMAWPGHIAAGGGLRSQFHHMIDIVPTILDAAGVAQPDTVDGIKQRPIEGVSMTYTWTPDSANVPSKRNVQYFEMFANRAIYKDGWIATTVPPSPPWLMGTAKMPPINQYKWELYNLANDFSQYEDLSAKYPDKLKELQAAFQAEAEKYQVLPLDNSILPRIVAQRPSSTAGRSEFVYTQPVAGIPMSSAPDVLFKDFTITADVYVTDAAASGMITTIGGRFGGIGLYLLGGKPVFDYNLLRVANFKWNGANALTPGAHRVVFDFKYDGPGPGKGGTGTLSVDGKVVATQQIPHTTPFLMNLGETLDIGSDLYTGVSEDYKLPFNFSGRIDKVVYKLGPPQLLSKAEIEAMEKARAQARQ